jgi:5-deoxy-5-amino-3-dehydroquinate dehydratase
LSVMLLLNGPNLGILGRREPEIYGTDTLADIENAVTEEVSVRRWEVVSIQSDSEGDLVGAIHKYRDTTVGAIVNPGALMIAGWSLRWRAIHRLGSRCTSATYGPANNSGMSR